MSYEGSNRLAIIYLIKKIIISNSSHGFVSKEFNKMGLALMDGNFFLFCPKVIKVNMYLSCEPFSYKKEKSEFSKIEKI